MIVRLILLFLLAFSCYATAYSHPCEQISIKVRKERKAIRQYIRFCKAKGLFKTDSGILVITEWKDNLSQKNWDISVLTRYYEFTQAPVGWARVGGRVILYYVRPIQYVPPTNNKLTQEESFCLAHLVEPYVKKVPPPGPNRVEVLDLTPGGKPRLDENGKPRTIFKFKRDYTSGGDGTYSHITFKKDGTVTRQIYL